MISRIMASHHLCRIFGIEVRVAYFLYVFVGLILMVKLMSASTMTGVLLVASFAAWPAFVLLHELGHALVAINQGMHVRKILLHVMGGVAELQGLIPNPASEILIAVAGPCVNLIVAAALFLPLLVTSNANLYDNLAGNSGVVVTLVTILLLINMSLAIFNFLPIFPMDGGRIATAIAVILVGPQRGTQMMGRVALIGVALLVGTGLYMIMVHDQTRMGIMLILVASFLYTTGRQEIQARMFVSRYRSSTIGRPQTNAEPPWGMPEWNPQHGFAPDHDKSRGWFSRWQQKRKEAALRREKEEHDQLTKKIDVILAKVKAEGLASLTPDERQTLNQASQAYKE